MHLCSLAIGFLAGIICTLGFILYLAHCISEFDKSIDMRKHSWVERRE
jgi:hypothetical protein